MSDGPFPAADASEDDLDMLETQLGRRPTGVLEVEVYCPAGHPQVIRYYPLTVGEQERRSLPFQRFSGLPVHP